MRMSSDSQVRPLGNLVLARMVPLGQRMTVGGLHIPNNAVGRERVAEVISVGSAVVDVSVGDTVVVDPYALAAVLDDGQMAQTSGTPLARSGDYFLVEEAAVVGVLEDGPEGPTRAQVVAALETIQRAGGFAAAQQQAEGDPNR